MSEMLTAFADQFSVSANDQSPVTLYLEIAEVEEDSRLMRFANRSGSDIIDASQNDGAIFTLDVLSSTPQQAYPYPAWLNACSGISLAMVPAGFIMSIAGVGSGLLVALLGFIGISVFGTLASQQKKGAGTG